MKTIKLLNLLLITSSSLMLISCSTTNIAGISVMKKRYGNGFTLIADNHEKALPTERNIIQKEGSIPSDSLDENVSEIAEISTNESHKNIIACNDNTLIVEISLQEKIETNTSKTLPRGVATKKQSSTISNFANNYLSTCSKSTISQGTKAPQETEKQARRGDRLGWQITAYIVGFCIGFFGMMLLMGAL